MCESLDEGAVKIEKAHCSSYFCDVLWHLPSFDPSNFYGVHACHPLFKDYPQVIHGWHMEQALLRFEVEVMLHRDLKNILYCRDMVRHIGTHCHTNIIHVYTDRSSTWFVLKDDVPVDVIHHGLEHSQ